VKSSLRVESVTGVWAQPGNAWRSSGGALLVVVNHTSHSIWSVSFKGRESGSWGDDFLEGAILPGDSAVAEVNPGLYHLRAEAADGTHVEHFGVSVGYGQLVRWVVEDEVRASHNPG